MAGQNIEVLKEQLARAYAKGKLAAIKGEPFASNPYNQSTLSYREWQRGYMGFEQTK